MELSRDGLYGRPDYLPHATRGTLSLHSLYLILWANFSAFYMALVTQPDAQEKISGPIISPKQHAHHYCMGQLHNAWRHMGDKLSLSPEEQSYFIMQCMERLLEVCIASININCHSSYCIYNSSHNIKPLIVYTSFYYLYFSDTNHMHSTSFTDWHHPASPITSGEI